MARRLVAVWSSPVAIIAEYTLLLDLITLLKLDTDYASHHLTDKANNLPLFRIAKRVGIMSESGLSVRVVTQGLGTVYMATHPSTMRKCIVLPASGIIDPLPTVGTSVLVAHLSPRQSMLQKGLLLGIGIELLDAIVHLQRETVIPSGERYEGGNETIKESSQPSIISKISPKRIKWTGIK